MLQRVLAVSFAQVLRAVSIVLLPLAFIALIAWATAGSTTGNTSDPMRAAIWLWLGAHHIPFLLNATAPGYLSYLPIGAMLLPFFALRSSFGRALSKLHGDFHNIATVRSIFASQYALVATLLALASRSPSVSSQWYLAPVFAFLIAYLAALTAGSRLRMSQAVSYATRVLAILLGASFVFLAITIFLNISTFKNIAIVLQPGFFGAILLFALNLFYLPNLAVSVLAYFTGTGFAVGTGTLVSPLTHRLGEIPALPILAVLPTSSSKWALIAIALVIALGALLATWALSSSTQALVQAIILLAISISLIAYLAGGSLMTPAMSAVGVSIWKVAISIIVELGIGVVAMVFIPQIRLGARK
jgi:hypothetical protein